MLDCLAKTPDERPPGAEDLARRLGEIECERPWSNEQAQAWWELHRTD